MTFSTVPKKMPPTQKHAYSPEGSSSKDHDDRGEQKRGPLKDMYVLFLKSYSFRGVKITHLVSCCEHDAGQ